MHLYVVAGLILFMSIGAWQVRSCVYNDALDDVRLESLEKLREAEIRERERADTERERADAADERADDALAAGEARAVEAETARQDQDGALQCSAACYQIGKRSDE